MTKPDVKIILISEHIKCRLDFQWEILLVNPKTGVKNYEVNLP